MADRYRPKPTALKRLAGNPGHRKLNEREPSYDVASTAVPRGRLGPDGKRLWRELAPLLAGTRLLTDADRVSLEILCTHYDFIRRAVALLDRDGLLTVGSRGQPVAHPAASILQAHSAAFRRQAVEFGLTPSSRSRLEMPEGPEEPSLQEQLEAMAWTVSDAD